MDKTYLCKTVSQNGEIFRELISSGSIDSIKIDLEKKGRFVLEIIEQNKFSEIFRSINPFKERVKSDDISLFSKELAILIRAGLPLTSCLTVLSQHSANNNFKGIILEIKKEVEG